MELRELAYQQSVLQKLDSYLAELKAQRTKAEKIEQANASESDPDLRRPPLDFPLKTWGILNAKGVLPAYRANIPYSPKTDGAGRPVPNIVYKVPTAGGKTFLAVSSLQRIMNQYLHTNRGFVLWIVPNEAIYTQTKRQLGNPRHPYRQLLNALTGNRVKLMEKTTTLNAIDVEQNLCVMLLMLQSANRDTRESLKMFRERGDVHGFTPGDDQHAHQKLREQVPNLDIYDLAETEYSWGQIKASLGNALRTIRPIVVLDEGHKATSELAFKTLYGFNPCFVLELTATPKDVKASNGANPKPARYQNILASVSGRELDEEGMIKMPINIDSRENPDWKTTLKAGLDRLNDLQKQADTLRANSDRYIRPIMLVQVERTGKNQRDGVHIHSEDVKEWLTSVGGLDEAEVAIKTAAHNDLKSPENSDLLVESSRVRVIITVQALQEGWDCPFAYVLCSLAPRAQEAAMTQLVGRILRQPQAQKTGDDALDSCYVITHRAETAELVKSIKNELEKSGMGDLVHSVLVQSASTAQTGRRDIDRAPKFSNKKIYLPKVLCVSDGKERELDYDEDILYKLDWRKLDVAAFVAKIPLMPPEAERQMVRVELDSHSPIRSELEKGVFDCAYTTHLISYDIILNPWIARQVVGKVTEGLKKRGGFDDERLGQLANFINDELRKWLFDKRDEMAKTLFYEGVAKKEIKFRLAAGANIVDSWKMPMQTQTIQPENAAQMINKSGGTLQRSLFAPMYRDDMNDAEHNVALYLDSESALDWWHRNVARHQYALQGWKRDRIYPDFICALNPNDKGGAKMFVLEMKGEHLAGNSDTEYKKEVMELLTDNFFMDKTQSVGSMNVTTDDGTEVHCELVLFSDWESELRTLFQ